ncbi:hypothetical protein POTG_03396 [Paenibacillus sp. oral taxon 786 str. D14]|nr:hypothetical protein POTG_03396 [Paenibacillus sp. oral taxon 786 str. D14]
MPVSLRQGTEICYFENINFVGPQFQNISKKESLVSSPRRTVGSFFIARFTFAANFGTILQGMDTKKAEE